MLRGVNLGPHNRIKMEALRSLYESQGFLDAQTCVQSGNVVFRTKSKDLGRLGGQIETAIEQTFNFRPGVILRTPSELKDVIARNPFATRPAIDPGKLLVWFLSSNPGSEVREKVLRIKAAPEELRIDGRELYIYFPNGMARPKLSMPAVERALQITGTGRNWNTVTKLLEIAERLEASTLMNPQR